MPTYNETADGGIVAGGLSIQGLDWLAAGGLKASGLSLVQQSSPIGQSCICGNTLEETATGGLKAGGIALVTSNSETVLGGIVCSGSAAVNVSTQVWDAFEAVYHLQESQSITAEHYQDSAKWFDGTGNAGNDLEYTPERTQGIWSYSQDFDGNDYITLPDFTLPDSSPLTIELWVKPKARFSERAFFSLGQRIEDGESWSIMLGHTRSLRPLAKIQLVGETDWERYQVVGDSILEVGCWYHFALVWQPGISLTLYVNGDLEAELEIEETVRVPGNGNYIGRIDAHSYARALIQEVTITPEIRTEDWINDEYTNICDTGFYTVGSEESPVYGG